MASFFLLGGALWGTMLPTSIRLLLLVGAFAPLTGLRVRGCVKRDASAAYPYPAQQSAFGGSRRLAGDDDPYRSDW